MTTLERFDALADQYIRSARRRNLTPDTITNYEGFIEIFRAFLKEREKDGTIGEKYVSFDDIQDWIDEMTKNGNKSSTIKQRLIVAGQFFRYATKPYIDAELRYEQSPVSPDFYPKTTTEAIADKLANDDIIALWGYNRKYKASEEQWARNYALVAVLLTTGLRNKEVLDLTLADIDLAYNEITVREGKGRKSRIVDMDSGGLCAAAIENYLRIGGRPKNISDSAPLFGTTASHSFGRVGETKNAEAWHRGTTAWLSQLVSRHIERQTDGRVVGCRTHQLRHAFARLQLNSTGNLAELQSLLGHTSPVVTERYSKRLCARRERAEVLRVLEARDEAAEQLRNRNADRASNTKSA